MTHDTVKALAKHLVAITELLSTLAERVAVISMHIVDEIRAKEKEEKGNGPDRHDT